MNYLHIKRLLDFLNLSFIFCGMFFTNQFIPRVIAQVIFPRADSGDWLVKSYYYLILQLIVLAINMYVCYVIFKSKDTVTNTVIECCEPNEEGVQLPDEEREQIRTILGRHLQLGDLADVSFGRLGRLVTETAVALCIICMVTSQMCTARQALIYTWEIAKSPNISNLPDIIQPLTGWDITAGAYAAIFLPIFIIFSIIPSYRCLGFLSALGMIGIVIGTYQYTLPPYNSERFFYYIFIFEPRFRFGSPQIGILILSLSNSAYDNRRGFMVSFLVSAGMCLSGIVLIEAVFIACHQCKRPVLDLEVMLGHDIGANAIIITAYIVVVFILNIPLFEICERKMSPFFKRSPLIQELSMQELFRGGQSLFRTLRRRNNGYLLRPSSLSLTTVARELKPDIPAWFSVLLRVTIVTIEWGLSCLCWIPTNLIFPFIFLITGVVTIMFAGYAFPLMQNLKLHWDDVRMAFKLFSCIIVASVVGLTVYIYVVMGLHVEY